MSRAFEELLATRCHCCLPGVKPMLTMFHSILSDAWMSDVASRSITVLDCFDRWCVATVKVRISLWELIFRVQATKHKRDLAYAQARVCIITDKGFPEKHWKDLTIISKRSRLKYIQNRVTYMNSFSGQERLGTARG